MPAFKYVWVGFCSVDVVPSPNAHDQLVGIPVERSRKETTSGCVPVFRSAVKPAFRTPGSGVGVGVGFGVGVSVGMGVGVVVGVTVGVGVGVGEAVGMGVGRGPLETTM